MQSDTDGEYNLAQDIVDGIWFIIGCIQVMI